MIFPSSAGRAQRMQRITAKMLGSSVQMRFTAWTGSKPAVDPTTGSVTSGGNGATLKTCTFKCLAHFVDLSKQAIRINQEIETGDVILDHLPVFMLVATAGGTALVVGSVVTLFAFNAANRATATDATGTAVAIASLEDVEFVIDSVRYAQKPIGDRLSKSWDAILGDVKFSQPILLSRAT